LLACNSKAITPREFNMPLPHLLPTRFHFGFREPKVNILGSEFAGEVEAVGRAVTRFKPGDQVMGYLGQRMGAYAEYVCMAETASLVIKPANTSHAEAATMPYGALMAISLLRRGNVQPGHRVLITGASGGIGSVAVQLVKHFGVVTTIAVSRRPYSRNTAKTATSDSAPVPNASGAQAASPTICLLSA
jgi:NADPH:quinone reductase-like Zn-dependent oxidoreductase